VALEIKFCGMTRREDVEGAAELGAAYVGVIFAGGPRQLSIERATHILDDLPSPPRRVGVFGDQAVDDVVDATTAVGLDVIQLHSGVNAPRIRELRARFSGEIWPVARIAGSTLPVDLDDWFELGDAVVLDAAGASGLGGTGRQLPWQALATAVNAMRRGRRLVLAGGLRPANLGAAVAALSPDVLDVSSGVESAPGIKDRDLMRAFRDAVHREGRAAGRVS